MMATRTTKRSNGIRLLGVALVALPMVTGCVKERVFNNGPQITQDQLDLVPVGSSKEQVLLALGSPSTTGTFDSEVFYYISQKRSKKYEFQRMQLVDQKVLTVYFDENQQVERIANFGLKDGRVFDFISRTTPTGGKDYTFLRQVLTGKASPASVLQGGGGPTSGPVGGGGPTRF